ncbi:Glutathione S-transferase [Pseudomonas syringae pv. actinidiae]|uniref:Glutathione S-transferase n=1 Tax=Pseudomonas syringae pv. actinidiae TaxID=103796 RepID=A0A2V0QCK3_PSESF|nr:Glutathione S-transferase [Pseudomonas syringae pv. actinidiae]
MPTKYLSALYFQHFQIALTVQRAGSEVIVVKRTLRVLALVFDVLYMETQANPVRSNFAIATQSVLLLQKTAQYLRLVAKTTPPACGGVVGNRRVAM